MKIPDKTVKKIITTFIPEDDEWHTIRWCVDCSYVFDFHIDDVFISNEKILERFKDTI